MNTLQKNKQLPQFILNKNKMQITMSDGRQIEVDIECYEKLKNVTTAQLNNFELSPFGIHWEDLDEDLCFEGFFYSEEGPKANE